MDFVSGLGQTTYNSEYYFQTCFFKSRQKSPEKGTGYWEIIRLLALEYIAVAFYTIAFFLFYKELPNRLPLKPHLDWSKNDANN